MRRLSARRWDERLAAAVRDRWGHTLREVHLSGVWEDDPAVVAADFCRFMGGLPADGWPALRSVELPGIPSAAGLDVLAAYAVTNFAFGPGRGGFWGGPSLARFVARVAGRVESLSLDPPTARQTAIYFGWPWPRLRRLALLNCPAGVVPALARADLPALDHLVCDLLRGSRQSPPAGLGRSLAESPLAGRLTSLGLHRWPGRALDEFWPALRVGRLRLLQVDDSNDPVGLPDLNSSPGLRGLRAARFHRIGFALAALSDPGVLPDLHTLWVDNSAARPAQSEPRWQGGRRTVLIGAGACNDLPHRDQWTRYVPG